MARKKSKRQSSTTGQRRGKRRSIRYEAVEDVEGADGLLRPPDAPEASVHLRRMTGDEALARLETDVRQFRKLGHSEMLVVHGRGQNSPGGKSVLGPLVRCWCDEHPNLVLRWQEAPRHWGGPGAIVVYLQPKK